MCFPGPRQVRAQLRQIRERRFDGHQVPTEQLVDAATALHDSGRPDQVALSELLLGWMQQRGVAIEPKAAQIETPSLDIALCTRACVRYELPPEQLRCHSADTLEVGRQS